MSIQGETVVLVFPHGNRVLLEVGLFLGAAKFDGDLTFHEIVLELRDPSELIGIQSPLRWLLNHTCL